MQPINKYWYSLNNVLVAFIRDNTANNYEVKELHTTQWGLIASIRDFSTKDTLMVLWVIKRDNGAYIAYNVPLSDADVLRYTKGVPKGFIDSLSPPISTNEARYRAIVRLINN